MSHRFIKTVALFSAVVLAACSGDVTSPTSTSSNALAPRAILDPNEGIRIITDSVDASGNTILVQEFPMGIVTQADGTASAVASVTIKSVISGTASSSKACITSSIVATDALPDVSLSIKKSGGCNKDIEILIQQGNLKATFKFSMVPGRTVIDSGALR